MQVYTNAFRIIHNVQRSRIFISGYDGMSRMSKQTSEQASERAKKRKEIGCAVCTVCTLKRQTFAQNVHVSRTHCQQFMGQPTLFDSWWFMHQIINGCLASNYCSSSPVLSSFFRFSPHIRVLSFAGRCHNVSFYLYFVFCCRSRFRFKISSSNGIWRLRYIFEAIHNTMTHRSLIIFGRMRKPITDCNLINWIY